MRDNSAYRAPQKWLPAMDKHRRMGRRTDRIPSYRQAAVGSVVLLQRVISKYLELFSV